jgi:pyridoxamine 5'-phosphate oxidase
MQYPQFYNSIPLTFDHMCDVLTNSYQNRNSPFRTMNICYIDTQKPYCRSVVLRHCDDNLVYLQFHTDYRSPKINALQQNPEIALHFYDSPSKTQITMNGIATIHYMNDISETSWAKTQTLSRRSYLTHLPPSTLIPEPHSGFDNKFIDNTQTPKETEQGYDKFAVVRVDIQKIDWVYLHAHGNRRIIFTKNDTEFNGSWCIP